MNPAIRTGLIFLSFDPDSIMTAEEAKRFDHSMDEFKKGKTTSLARVKKEIRL